MARKDKQNESRMSIEEIRRLRNSGMYDSVPRPKGKVENLFHKIYAPLKSDSNDARSSSDNGDKGPN